MRRELVFGIYLVLVAFSVLCMGLILLLLAKGEEGKRQRYQAARNFSLVVFGMILLYLAFYYQDTVARISAVPLLWRLADYLLWALLPLSWLRLCREMLGEAAEGAQKWLKAGEWTALVTLAAALPVAVFFQGPYYEIGNDAVRRLWGGFTVASFLATTGILIALSVHTLRSAVPAGRKSYIVLCMALQLWGHFSQLLLDLDMAKGSYILLGWNYNQGMVSFVASMLLLNAATLIFAFRGEFRETYLRPPEVPAETAPRMTPEERLDLLAERYQLTAREREIVALMQEGRSNPEIGEALYVTRNTVKKHIQNIYEKLGVNSRKGLEELLEEQDHPPG